MITIELVLAPYCFRLTSSVSPSVLNTHLPFPSKLADLLRQQPLAFDKLYKTVVCAKLCLKTAICASLSRVRKELTIFTRCIFIIHLVYTFIILWVILGRNPIYNCSLSITIAHFSPHVAQSSSSVLCYGIQAFSL